MSQSFKLGLKTPHGSEKRKKCVSPRSEQLKSSIWDWEAAGLFERELSPISKLFQPNPKWKNKPKRVSRGGNTISSTFDALPETS